MKRRWAVLVSLALGTAACAVGDVSSPGSSGNGGAGTGNAGNGGTVSSGQGGSSSPCAMDCSLITTPDCQLSECNPQTGQCEVINAAGKKVHSFKFEYG